MPTSQKAEVRPISFVLHDQATKMPPFKVGLNIRPEDLTRNEQSRLTVHQTLGSAWADNFGPSIPVINISGHTGWGQGDRWDGAEQFTKLHEYVFKKWHAQRAFAVENGLDPDLVKLIFLDQLDGIECVVAPQNFVLRRNKSRPLLSQYQISMSWLSDDVAETKKALAELSVFERESLGFDSLDASLDAINSFLDGITAEVNAFFGPIKGAVRSLLTITSKVLTAVRKALGKDGIIGAVFSNLYQIATMLTKAASNVLATVITVQSLPARIKAAFMRVKSQFMNAHCILMNVFKSRKFLSNYDELYGASFCSSTAGGRPLSKYLNVNTMESLISQRSAVYSVSGQSVSALTSLMKTDPTTSAMSLQSVASLSGVAANGIMVSV